MQGRYLTAAEVAAALGVDLTTIYAWLKDRTIPPSFYVQLEGRTYHFRPATLALGALVLELASLFGSRSPIPKAVARQNAHRFEALWSEPELPVRLTVSRPTGTLETGSLGFLVRAHERYHALAS